MVRPNPKYDPVTGIVTTPTTPKEPRPNPRYGTPIDDFVMIDGYSRNLVLEEKLEHESIQADNLIKNMGEFNPLTYAVPSWWHTSSDYGWGFDTHQKALDYLEISKRYYQAKINLYNYKCNNYPRDTVFCQHAAQFSGIVGHLNTLIPIIQKRISGFEFPEILPQASAEEEPSAIISNAVTEVTTPTPGPTPGPTPPQIDDSINTNMVTQQVINFNIINGRAVGSIKFVATNNFNPYYYNKEIINLVQFKTPNGVTLLVKENRLRFTQTERDEIINYDESVQENTRITVESFVWEWMDKPAGAFSNKYTIDISEKEPPKPTTSGFMGAGVAGAIASLILIGFIADHKRGK